MRMYTSIVVAGLMILSAMLVGAANMDSEGVEEPSAIEYDWWEATGVNPMYFDSPQMSIQQSTWYIEGAMIGCPRTDAKLISAGEGLWDKLHDDYWVDPDHVDDKGGAAVYRSIISAMRGIGQTCGADDVLPSTEYYCEVAENQLVIAAWALADILMEEAEEYVDYDPYIQDKLYQAYEAEGKAYDFYYIGNTVKTIHYLKNSWNYAGLALEKGVELECIEAYTDSLYYIDLAMVEVAYAEEDLEAEDNDAAVIHLDAADEHLESSHESIMDVLLDYWWSLYYKGAESAINGLLALATAFPWLENMLRGLILQLKLNLAEMLLGHAFGTFTVSISYNPNLGDGVDGETSQVDANGDGAVDGASIEIGPEAFDGLDDKEFSEPWLLSTVLHEKVHAMQAHEGRWYTDTNGAAVNELEAYDSETRNAGKTGLDKAEKADTESRRDDYHNDMTANKDKYGDADNDGTMDVNEDNNPNNNNPNYTHPP